MYSTYYVPGAVPVRHGGNSAHPYSCSVKWEVELPSPHFRDEETEAREFRCLAPGVTRLVETELGWLVESVPHQLCGGRVMQW